MAEHLLGGADVPQYEPGHWTRDETGLLAWLFKYRGQRYCDTVSRPTAAGVCRGCLSPQPIRRGRIAPHEPAEPQYENCGVPGHPNYRWLSYTQPPCDECATATDEASYDRGDSVSGIY